MKTSAAGRAAIEQREGRRLAAYHDSRGILTIGVGHTGRMSAPPVTARMTITEAECDAMLAADLAPVEAVIDKAVKVPLSQNEFDALASWLFNVGAGALRRSTILARINLGDLAGAASAFDLYHKPPEIIGRRNAEKAQFLRPDATSAATAATRAKTLAAWADTHKTHADIAKAAAIVTGAAGATVVTAAVTTAHPTAHPTAVAAAGGVSTVVALVQALFARWKAARARTLDANAAAQADASI